MAGTRKNYSEVHKVLDPIIKESPKINYKLLEEKHPEIATNISYGAFLARKKKLLGREGYTYKPRVKVKKRKYVRKKGIEGSIPLEIIENVPNNLNYSDQMIEEFINERYPNTKNLKEYKNLFRIFLKEPKAVFSKYKKEGLVKVSDAIFYAFRKEVSVFINGEESQNSKSKKSKVSMDGIIYKSMHTNLNATDEEIEEMKIVTKKIQEEFGLSVEILLLKKGYELRRCIK